MFKLIAIASVGVAVIGSGAKWTANLESKGGSKVIGTATVEQMDADRMSTTSTDSTKPAMPMAKDSFKASVTIKGAMANATQAWHVHSGSCAAIGATVGAATGYPEIKVGSDGSGQASATISGSLGSGGYAVAVHKGNAETETVACGDLRPSTTP